ncbi:3554ae4a-292a-4429-8472-669fa190c2f3 [Sclerotinia trifoliorum]|uniref:3554ae4a-292a-4429-8472-669fa190c2f3 n=1 Tax=Sclerotinia trifoliorum TaxID=28548 RepID=A0A8H2W234_9HELO|nr:3554ae4a-292a-4429-8472-669fa190c2f3 [Sclerotinia trifoliorum]
MKKAPRGIKCTRKLQLQSKLTIHKTRTKLMKKKSVMASKKLPTIMDWKCTAEKVTESLPGKGQTLDGKTESKGKGISKFEENDVSDWCSKKEGPLDSDDDADGDRPIQVFSPEELASGDRFIVDATKLHKREIERIILFHGVFCKAYNDIVYYTQYHSKIEDSHIERVNSKGGAVEGQFCPANHLDEIMEAKNKIEGVDDIPGTLYTPKVVLQRIQDGFSSLQQIWQKIVEESLSAVTSRDLTIPIQKIDEIEKMQFIMKAIDIIDGDSQSTNEIRIQGPECTHPACDDCACYYEAGRLNRDKDEDKEALRNLPIGKYLSLGTKSPIKKSTSSSITRTTGCACGTLCAGPSRSR